MWVIKPRDLGGLCLKIGSDGFVAGHRNQIGVGGTFKVAGKAREGISGAWQGFDENIRVLAVTHRESRNNLVVQCDLAGIFRADNHGQPIAGPSGLAELDLVE